MHKNTYCFFLLVDFLLVNMWELYIASLQFKNEYKTLERKMKSFLLLLTLPQQTAH